MKTLFILCISVMLLMAAESKPKVAVIDFEAQNPEHSIILSDQIRTNLSMSPSFILLTRDALTKIMTEQKFQVSGLVNEETQSEFGQLIGAQYLVTGRVTKSGINYFLTVQLIEVKTGTVISSGSASAMSIQLLCTSGCEKIASALLQNTTSL